MRTLTIKRMGKRRRDLLEVLSMQDGPSTGDQIHYAGVRGGFWLGRSQDQFFRLHDLVDLGLVAVNRNRPWRYEITAEGRSVVATFTASWDTEAGR